MADDLQRFLDFLPIKAKAPSLVTRASKWSRRHRVVVLSASMCLAVVAVLATFSSMWVLTSYRKLYRQRQEIVDAYQLSTELRESQIESTRELASPRRMVFRHDGTVYVTSAGNDSICRFNAKTGALLGVLVPSGRGGLDNPIGMAFLQNGELYVASANNDKVLRYNARDGTFLGEFVPAHIEQLHRPSDLMLRGDGFLYVTSDSGQILRFDVESGQFHDIFIDHVPRPRGPIIGPDGRFYVCNYLDHCVLRFDATSGAMIDTFINAEHELLKSPAALAFGPDGHLYVGCDLTSCVLKFDGSSGEFTGVFVQPNSRGLHGVADIAFRDDGLLYVCSRQSSEILRYGSRTGEFVDVFVSTKSSISTASELFMLSITLSYLGEKEQAKRRYKQAVEQIPEEMRSNPQLEKLRRKARALIEVGER